MQTVVLLVVVIICLACAAWSSYKFYNAWQVSEKKLHDERAKNGYIKNEKAAIDEYLQQYRKAQLDAIDAEYDKINKDYEAEYNSLQSSLQDERDELEKEKAKCSEQINGYIALVSKAQEEYHSLLNTYAVAKQSEEDKRKYCLHIPEHSKDDIDALYKLSETFHNKDAIYKLIWSEYIQRPLTELLLKNNIGEVSGIYRIANINTNECYIGRSVNVRKRLIDHVKSAIGIGTIADQYVHHKMHDDGLWNFSFELLCQCKQSELSEKEKFYITSFNSQQYGYNKNIGG